MMNLDEANKKAELEKKKQGKFLWEFILIKAITI